jgi:hypothetical protein
MDLCDGLPNDRKRCGSAIDGSEFFVDVKCGLILLAALQFKIARSEGLHARSKSPEKAYNSHSNPRLSKINQQGILRPPLRSLDLL